MADDQKVKFSKLASAIRGLGDSASLGFMDEGIGGLKAGYDVATDPNKHLADLSNLYTQYRDKYRNDTKDAEAQNPLSYKAGEAAGALASTALPGSVVKAPGMAAAALGGATYGGLSGLGHSDANTLSGLAQDTGIGAGVGAVAGPALHAATNAVGAQFPGLTRALGGAPAAVENEAQPLMPMKSGTTELKNALDEGAAGLNFAKSDAQSTADRISNAVQNNPNVKVAAQQKQANNAMQSAQDLYETKIKNQGTFDPDATNPGVNNTNVIPDDTEAIQKNLNPRNLRRG